MTAKFKRTFSDTMNDIKKGAVAAAQDMSDNTKFAYDVKRKEIEEKHIPKFAKDALTPEEIRRSERAGLVVGMTIILVTIIIIAGYFWMHTVGVPV